MTEQSQYSLSRKSCKRLAVQSCCCRLEAHQTWQNKKFLWKVVVASCLVTLTNHPEPSNPTAPPGNMQQCEYPLHRYESPRRRGWPLRFPSSRDRLSPEPRCTWPEDPSHFMTLGNIPQLCSGSSACTTTRRPTCPANERAVAAAATLTLAK